MWDIVATPGVPVQSSGGGYSYRPNPSSHSCAISYALLALGIALTHSDPVAALEPARRGRQVAEDSGNRGNGTHLASLLARLEAEYGDALGALHYIALAIRNHHDSGNRWREATRQSLLTRSGLPTSSSKPDATSPS
jgi:hypothetical protein